MAIGRNELEASKDETSSSIPSFVSFPLTRFSYATLRSKDDKNTPYQHESGRDDLFLVFDINRVMNYQGELEEHRILKVIRGADRLEYIDLHEKIRHEKLARNVTSFSNIDVLSFSIIALVSWPRLAIRYTTVDFKIRRVQCSISERADFDMAVHILRSIGWPMSEASARPTTLASRGGLSDFASSSQDSNRPTFSFGNQSAAPKSALELDVIANATKHTDLGLHVPPPLHSPPLQAVKPLREAFTTPKRSNSAKTLLHVKSPLTLNGIQPSTFTRGAASRPITAPIEINSRNSTAEKTLWPSKTLSQGFGISLNDLSPLPRPTFRLSQEETPQSFPMPPGFSMSQSSMPTQKVVLPRKRPYSAIEESLTSTASHDVISQNDVDSRVLLPMQPPENVGKQLTTISPDLDLAVYAKLPVAERTASLDKWIVEMIEDEGFLLLLEDMQNAWRRIGFNRY